MNDRVKNYQKGWHGGLPETPCGWGSKLSTTKAQREWIPKMVEKYKIKSIADIGAGDLNWIRQTHLPNNVKYTPYDLVPRFPEVQFFDLMKSPAPKADLIMCLWVLNHFPKDECRIAIDNLKKSKAKYLLITHRPKYIPILPEEHNMPYIESMMIDAKIECYLLLIDLRALDE